MKALITFCFALFFLGSITCQVEIQPNVLKIVSDGSDVELKPNVINNSGEDKMIMWMFEPGEDYPEEWVVIVCDDTLCYGPDVMKSNPNLAFPMEDGYSFKFSIKFECNGVPGDSYAILTLFDDLECNSTVATTQIPTSTKDNLLPNSFA